MGSLTTGAQTCQQLAFAASPLTQPTRGCPTPTMPFPGQIPSPALRDTPIPLPAQLPPGFFPPNKPHDSELTPQLPQEAPSLT